jgi:hypothetical protein
MGSLDRRQLCGWSSRLPHELRRRATLVAVSASLHSDECRGESELRRKKDRSIEQTKAQEEKKSMVMKGKRIGLVRQAARPCNRCREEAQDDQSHCNQTGMGQTTLNRKTSDFGTFGRYTEIPVDQMTLNNGRAT